MKNIVIFSPNPYAFWLPALWCQAKTYYEKHGTKVGDWHWHPCYADLWQDDIEKVKEIVRTANPDVFCISLYVWNARECHEIAKWVQQEFPKCIIVSGGPHQYFKYDKNWFKDRPWLDASLPGDSYGEITVADILDNYDNLDWNKVTGVVYPRGKNKTIFHSKKTLDRSSFDFTWSQYSNRHKDIIQLLDYKHKHRPRVPTCAILETTRGCPYTCTFCDWGGGIGSKLINRSLHVVEQDINTLSSLNINTVYISDANIGILGNRDVAVVDLLAKSKKKFKVLYGGFAKTEHHLPYIKQIIDLTWKYNLDHRSAFKLSVQSLDRDVLRNINRTNIPLKKLIELHNNTPAQGYVEFILALPGSTYDIMLKEIDVMLDYDLFGEWYEWILLPEAPAYDPEYRKKYGIKTVKKTAWTGQQREQEVVVATNSCSTDDYLKMLLAQAWYNFCVQGGVHRLTSSKEIDLLINEFLPSTPYWLTIKWQWQQILNDPDRSCDIIINNRQMPLKHLFTNLAFYEHKDFMPMLERWFGHSIDSIHVDNIGTTRWQGLKRITYANKNLAAEENLYPETMSNYACRQLLIPKTKLLGIL